MTASILRGVLTALLVSSVPGAAYGYDWMGRVGLLYDRTDTWPGDDAHHVQPRLNLDLAGSLDGSVVDPGVVAWKLAASYRRDSASFDGSETRLNSALGYHFDAAFFRNPTSPFTATVFADRSDSTFDDYTGTPFSGDRLAQSFGGGIRLAPHLLPTLHLDYRRTDVEETLPLVGAHESSSDRLAARFTQSSSTFNAFASFVGEWNDGTWVYDQNSNYTVTADAHAYVDDDTQVFVSDTYYNRVPDTSAADAFAQELNSFSGGFRSGRKAGEKTVLRYVGRRLYASTQLGTTESTSNGVNFFQDFLLGTEGDYLTVSADASMHDGSTPLGSTASRGGTLGADYAWNRSQKGGNSYELAAGPRVGYVVADGSKDQFGYGARARGSVATSWNGYGLSGVYSVLYGNNLSGQVGWVLEQRASASARGRAGAGNVGVTLAANTLRRYGPNGDEAVRGINLVGDYRWRDYAVLASYALSSGVLPGTPDDFVGDGFFVPVGFDTQQQTFTLGANARIFTGLVGSVELRYASSSLPGQPDLETGQGIASLSYRFGMLEISLEDRVTGPSLDPTEATANLVMLRASRTFGSRF